MDNLSVIRTFLKERLNVDAGQIKPEDSLKDLGVDSLMLLELMFEFEEKLNITLSKDIASPKTVGDLIAVVEQMHAAQAAH